MGAFIKKGDRVRVAVEGTVTFEGSSGVDVAVSDDVTLSVFADEARRQVVIEKIEPPVEQFKPGDVVRHKTGGKPLLLLEGNRYAYLEDGSVATDSPVWFAQYMTSEWYERVDLAPAG